MKNIYVNIGMYIALALVMIMTSCHSTFTRYNYVVEDIDVVGITHIEVREDIFDVEIEQSMSDTVSIEVYAENVTMKGMGGAHILIEKRSLYDVEIQEGHLDVKIKRSMMKNIKRAEGVMKIKVPQDIQKICVRSRSANVSLSDMEVDTLQIFSEKAKTVLKNVKVENPVIRSRRVEITEE